MRTIDFSIRTESWEKQRAAGRYNPGQEISPDCSGRFIPIGAGTSDSVYCYRHHFWYVVLSVNYQLEYAGVELFSVGEHDKEAELFCQGSEELEQIVGPKGLDLTPMTIARRLAEHAIECFC